MQEYRHCYGVEQTMAAGDIAAGAVLAELTSSLNGLSSDSQSAQLRRINGQVGCISNTSIASCIYRYLPCYGWIVLLVAQTADYPALGRWTDTGSSLDGNLEAAISNEFAYDVVGVLSWQESTTTVSAGVMENARICRGSFSYTPSKAVVELFRTAEQLGADAPDLRLAAVVQTQGALPVGGACTCNFAAEYTLQYELSNKRLSLW
jgi:hypothetical protein